MSQLEYDRQNLPAYEPQYTFNETVVYDLIQNISEERQMTKGLVERLKSQFKDTDVEVEPSNNEEVTQLIRDEEMESLKEELESAKSELQEEKQKRKNIDTRYKNLKGSFFGKLQTKYWLSLIHI